MHIEKVTYRDLYGIKQLQQEGWPDISIDFMRYIHYDFCAPVKMCIGSEIVGIGCAIMFKKSAWLAHIIVAPTHRNKGMGFQIVDYLIKSLNEMGIHAVSLIATSLGAPVYKKAGFSVVSDYVYFKRASDWNNTELSDHITFYTAAHYKQLVDLDYQLSGERRESLLQKHLDNCLVYSENGVLSGYYFPFLGEGGIFARNSTAGIALMKVKYATVDKAVIPSGKETGIAFLKQQGFVESDTKGTRMILGEEVHWNPNGIFSRIGGNYG